MKPIMLITGSTGLIGSTLCRHFASEFKVVGFDRDGGSYPPDIVDWLFVDFASDESLQNGMHLLQQRYGTQIASVIHLAAYYDFAGEPSDKYTEVTVNGTERLLRELQRFEVEQFIFSSSMLVHKPTSADESITEDSPIEPTWDYPKSKVEAEAIVQERRGDIHALVLRIAGVYDDMCHSVPIANQIKRTFERDVTSLLYPGEFEAGQSFIHLDDLVACYDVAVKRRRELPEHLVLLIGEPDIVSYRQMQTIIAEELDRPDWLAPIPKPIAKFGAWAKERVLGEDTFIKPWMVDRADDTYRLDITKAQQILQWQPKHKLQDELPKLVRNFKRDPQAWYRVNRLPMPDWLEQRKAG